MDENVKQNLKRAGLLAASDQPADHDQLIRLLGSQKYLESLQALEDYDVQPPTRLLVARVIKTLMKSPHPVAQSTLVRLTGMESFTGFESLDELLVIALVAVRPLPPPAVAFLDARSTPDATPLHLVMTTLAANSSDPAIRLFEQKIADTDHDEGDRTVWLRTEYLTRRNDIPILHSYKRMIVDGVVPSDMRYVALESLCSYDPQWYLACTKPEPPLRLLASSEAKKILRKIIDYVQRQPLSRELRMAVETVSMEIGDGESA